MNVQDYIESGSIESCMLQLASEREQRELDRLCAEYPEIQAARDAFEASLERAALEGAVAPPAFIRDAALSVIHDTAQPAKKSTDRLIRDDGQATVRRFNWTKLAIAASLLLLAGSTALNVYLYNQFKTSQELYSSLLARQQEMANSNKAIQVRLSLAEKEMEMMKDPNMLLVKMGDVNNTNSMGTVYWDARSKNVYLLVNHLPKPQAGQQYQLWAMVDGKPVDAGMVEMDSNKALLPMKNIPKAEAFAITLEKAGGSPTPTLTAMYVMGKV
ncbi:anti-sigma factor [Flavihumibacter fluvii]|uniref:anti-sigma factor n=1 Tax=Flavihumibacter fluvii TaxID=2838157 RepID=UPI001BDF516A|nr:anti-sigma factor [Flavihumibacter fluvii]ULQ51202.1 anti-sigma factor [Flavihumibacter fluvii]